MWSEKENSTIQIQNQISTKTRPEPESKAISELSASIIKTDLCGQCPHGCSPPAAPASPWDIICSCDDLGIKDFLGERSQCTACMNGKWIALAPAWCLKKCDKCPEGCTKAQDDPSPWDLVCDCQNKRCIACRNGDFVGLAADNKWCKEERNGVYPFFGSAIRQLHREGELREKNR